MKNELDKLQEIRKYVMEKLNNGPKKQGVQSETIISVKGYNSLPVTTPENSNEVALTLEDVIVVTKKMLLDNNDSITGFEVYGENSDKILETETDGRIKFDREIFDDKIQDKIKIIEDAGYEVAGMNTMDEEYRIQSFFEIINEKLTAINKSQKEELEMAKDVYERNRALSDISGSILDSRPENKEKRQQEKIKQSSKMAIDSQNNPMVEELRRQGIDVHKIVKIDPSDGAFWENNPDIPNKEAYAVLSRSGELNIVNGSLEPVKGFKNSKNNSGRTTIIRNDEDSLEDNVKNTYGSLESTRNPNIRYTIELGQYGEPKLVEQIRQQGGSMEESDKWVSREVQTNNTNFTERNLEGNESSENITVRTFRQRTGTSRDAKMYGSTNGRGGVQEIADNMKDKAHRDYNMESFAADVSQREAEALERIKIELNDRGIELTEEEKDSLEQKLKVYLGNQEKVFCDEDAVQYANEIQMERSNSRKKDEEYEEKEEDMGRSIEDDAMNRRLR